MKADKIKQIIDRENERNEDNMADDARNIIRAITLEQGKIQDCNKRIEELREQLLKLEHAPIAHTDIIKEA